MEDVSATSDKDMPFQTAIRDRLNSSDLTTTNTPESFHPLIAENRTPRILNPPRVNFPNQRPTSSERMKEPEIKGIPGILSTNLTKRNFC